MLEHTVEAKRFYKSKAWRDCRASYISSVFGLCEVCNRPGLIVHHKIHINSNNIDDPEVTLNHENLQLVCIEDHNRIHFNKQEVLREGLMFDVNGDLIQIKNPFEA